jgi:hypothetical protein
MNGQAIVVCYFGFGFFGGFVSRLVYGRVEIEFFWILNYFLCIFCAPIPGLPIPGLPMNGQAVVVCYFGFDFFGGFMSRLVYGRVMNGR